MKKKSFTDQPPEKKAIISVLIALQVGLLGAAHWDISQRNAVQIRGSKGKWRAITLISFIGPIWYLLAEDVKQQQTLKASRTASNRHRDLHRAGPNHRRRRQTRLSWQTPIEYERTSNPTSTVTA